MRTAAEFAASHTEACVEDIRINHDENLSMDYPAPGDRTFGQRDEFYAELDRRVRLDLEDCVGCTCDNPVP